MHRLPRCCCRCAWLTEGFPGGTRTSRRPRFTLDASDRSIITIAPLRRLARPRCSAADDIRDDDGSPSATRVEQLVADLENARQVKLTDNMRGILDSAAAQRVAPRYPMANGGDIELSFLKAGLFKALDELVGIDMAQAALDAAQSQAALDATSRFGGGGSAMRAPRGAGAAAAGSRGDAGNSSFLSVGGVLPPSDSAADDDEEPRAVGGRLRARGFAGRLAAAAAAAAAGGGGGGAGGGDDDDDGR